MKAANSEAEGRSSYARAGILVVRLVVRVASSRMTSGDAAPGAVLLRGGTAFCVASFLSGVFHLSHGYLNLWGPPCRFARGGVFRILEIERGESGALHLS